MTALAVAALLTITALAIWAVRVLRRPVDWEGPLTSGPPPELMLRYWPMEAFGIASEDAAKAIRRRALQLSNTFLALRASERDDRRKEGR